MKTLSRKENRLLAYWNVSNTGQQSQAEVVNHAFKKTVPDQNNEGTGNFNRALEAKAERHRC